MKEYEKICVLCGVSYTAKHPKSKYCSKCKQVVKKSKDKEYYEKNKNGKIAEYKAKNREHILKQKKLYRESHKEEISQKFKEYVDKLKVEGVYSQRRKKSRDKHKEKAKRQSKEYRRKNKKVINKRKSQYEKQKRKTDPLYNLKHNIRNTLWRCLKCKKDKHTFDILGYSCEELFANLESKFYGGMCWSNQDQWEIHHVIPLCKFDFINEKQEINYEELKRANALDNLIPLWKDDHKTVTKYFLEQNLILTSEQIYDLIISKREDKMYGEDNSITDNGN